MNWYLKVVKDNYANFSGRARRKEYWMFVLINTVISFVIGFIGGFIGGVLDMPVIGSVLSLIYTLALLVPSLAVGVRRLHDIGKSGWWLFISFIPVIGWIWIIVLLVTDSQTGENKWGKNPKE